MRSKNAEWFPMIENFINQYREQNIATWRKGDDSDVIDVEVIE